MTTTPRREQVLLPGQAAATPGPVDLTGMYVMHHAFRRDLSRFFGAVDSTPANDREGYERLARRWRLFTSALHHHHEGEDAGLWPMLRGRVVDEDDALTLEAMAIEHESFNSALTQCGAWFGRLAAGGDEGDRRRLVARLARLEILLTHHLDHEETECLPLVQKHMSQADWDFVDKEYFQKGLTPGEIIALVPWALHGLPEVVRRRVLAALPAAFRVTWRLTHTSFERGEQRTFGPPATIWPERHEGRAS